MKKRMKIALIGSRGIPAKYGGTETFVEEIATGLKKRGHDIYVTCETSSFKKDMYDGIHRIHVPSIEWRGIVIPSVNDVIATFYLIINYPDIDIFYFLAPGSSPAAVIPRLLKKKIAINPDGLEWKRSLKRSRYYSKKLYPLFVAHYLYVRIMEYLSCKLPDITVADSLGIKEHLERKYNPRRVVYIAYGARELLPSKLSMDEERRILKEFGLEPNGYYLTVARIVAENNIHLEVEGFKKSKSTKKLVIVGNFNRKDPYTRHLLKLKGDSNNIIFLDSIYDKEVLGVLRKNCFAYIHAYEVGGTNPSLLEQMLFKRPILAYDVPFNKEVLQEGGIYFKDARDLANKMEMLERGEFDLKVIKKTQIKRIKRQYNWEKVAREYERAFGALIGRK